MFDFGALLMYSGKHTWRPWYTVTLTLHAYLGLLHMSSRSVSPRMHLGADGRTDQADLSWAYSYGVEQHEYCQ